MILARLWQVALAALVAVALGFSAVTVAIFDRREADHAEGFAVAQVQTLRKVLETDARRSLDALALAAVNDDVQKALAAFEVNAGGKEKDTLFRALSSAIEKIPSELRGDAHVIVDRSGTAATFVNFRELEAASSVTFGAAPTVIDALHGYLRDDVWVLGGKLFRVVARPIEDDFSHPPLGAILAFTRLDGGYAQRISDHTGASFAFFSAGQLAGKGAATGFDPAHFDAALSSLPRLATDETFTTTGSSKASSIAPHTVAIFGKLAGDAWDLDAGFVLLRTQAPLLNIAGVFQSLTDDDKAALPMPLLGATVIFLSLLGLALLWLEHDRPLKRFAREAEAFKAGEAPRLQLANLARAHRAIAEAVNDTVDRLAENGSGAPRRAADLQSIVGAPASSSGLSAFHVLPPPASPAPHPQPAPSVPLGPPAFGTFSSSAPVPTSISSGNAGLFGMSGSQPIPSPSRASSRPLPSGPPPPRPSQAPPRASAPPAQAAPQRPQFASENDEDTMLAALRGATSNGSPEQLELAEWRAVYEDFVRTKQTCSESIEGLSFEKFQNTLRKNRDSIRERYQCERVKFTVYVKEGRASLKASPIRAE